MQRDASKSLVTELASVLSRMNLFEELDRALGMPLNDVDPLRDPTKTVDHLCRSSLSSPLAYDATKVEV